MLHSITSPRNRTFAPILSIFALDTTTPVPSPPAAVAAAAAADTSPAAPVFTVVVRFVGLVSRDLALLHTAPIRLEELDRNDLDGEVSTPGSSTEEEVWDSSSSAVLLRPNLCMATACLVYAAGLRWVGLRGVRLSSEKKKDSQCGCDK